jgi:hypothetical protein
MPLARPRADFKKPVFCAALGSSFPAASRPIRDVISDMDAQARIVNPNITGDALNNCHGSWYEWLLAAAAWNAFCNHHTAFLSLLLPNVAQLNVEKLYIPSLEDMIRHLRDEATSSGVILRSSNPDFAIVANFDARTSSLPKPIRAFTSAILDELENLYTYIIGKCKFEDIRGFISAKYSFRPDRRLQIPHEGSLMKALYVHLQTRQWITNPIGLKYYAVAGSVSDADIKALKTVATHSITTVASKPEPAVNEVFTVSSLREAEAVFVNVQNPPAA